MNNKFHQLTFNFYLNRQAVTNLSHALEKYSNLILFTILSTISVSFYIYYYLNGLGLAYNDARSHLDIGRRVVEGLKPGLAQLGSVWLPLPHILMILTVWNDFMWHSGLSGAIQSMASFVAVGFLVYKFLQKLGVGMLGRVVGVAIFVANLNVLYLQSTAMTELLLLATMTAGIYELLIWQEDETILHLILSSFWIMAATLIRYDGWFLFLYVGFLIAVLTLKKRGIKTAEGHLFFYATLSGLGILLWFLWNQLIFKDALYFIFGPYSAHAQQQHLEAAGDLATKGNLFLSIKVYFYALAYNSGTFTFIIGMIGAAVMLLDKYIKPNMRIVATALFAPLLFNIIALYLGHSVLFVNGISGNTWFNVRYGIMMMPSIAIFIGYLVHRAKVLRYVLIGLLLFVTYFAFVNGDAVTVDDAQYGSSQKNVSEVSGWLQTHSQDKKGFVLISAASHDAIIFSSGLPMAKFIHEGTGKYWDNAVDHPDLWARWIVMRTNDMNDLTYRSIYDKPGLKNYRLVDHYPFADIYEIKPEYLGQIHTTPVLGKQK